MVLVPFVLVLSFFLEQVTSLLLLVAGYPFARVFLESFPQAFHLVYLKASSCYQAHLEMNWNILVLIMIIVLVCRHLKKVTDNEEMGILKSRSEAYIGVFFKVSDQVVDVY